MTWSDIRAAFERLVGEPAETRERRLSELDPELAAEVRVLLESDSTAGGFLERSHISAPRAVPGPAEGTRLGHFALLRPLGSGGMGVVWEAQQESPSRRVALKILASSGWSRAERWRFEYEAQVLASLGHPSIARLYEAGSEAREGGELSWFAMELVEDARDLLTWADEEEADRERRLALFADLCEAVQYGHRRGVIHRDLKPANVLVGKDGRLKLIDFGVARAVEGSEATPSLRTQTGEIVGTLQYMAPEQVAGRGREVDVRSDVYSLGVILYRLLVGVPPFDLSHASLASIARTVLEEEPRRPSTVQRDLAGDLEWIMLKALEKDPARRYQSVAELAEDLRRFEEHRPVLAHTPSALYRLEKFVRRNRTVVAIACTAVLGTGVAIWGITDGMLRARAGEQAAVLASQETGKQAAIARTQETRAREQQQIAELESDRNRRVLKLVESLFEGIDERIDASELKVVDLIDARVLDLDGEDLDPDTELVLRTVLGKMYTGLRVFDRAREELERALAVYPATRKRASDRSLEVAARAHLGLALTQLGETREGVRLMRESFAQIEEEGLDADVHDAQVGLLIHLHDRGEFEELRDRAASFRAFAERTQHERKTELKLRARWFEAMALSGLGCYEDALALLEQIWRDCVDALGQQHWQSVEALVTYSRALQQAKRDVEAEELLTQAIPLLRSVYGPTHALTLGALNNRAVLADTRGDERACIEDLRELIRAYDTLDAPSVPGLMTALNNLGNALVAICEYDEAEPVLRRAVELSRSPKLGPSLKGPQVRFNHGACLAAMMRWEEAEPLLLENYEIFRDLLGPEHDLVRSAANTIAVACDRNGYPEEAESWRQGR